MKATKTKSELIRLSEAEGEYTIEINCMSADILACVKFLADQILKTHPKEGLALLLLSVALAEKEGAENEEN